MGYLYAFIFVLSVMCGYAFYVIYGKSRLELMLTSLDFGSMSDAQIYNSCWKRTMVLSILFTFFVAFLAYTILTHLVPIMAAGYQ